MKIKELTVMLSKKVSDENYGSKGVTVGLTVDLEDGDDKDMEYAALSSWCAAKIGGTLKAHGALESQVLRDAPKKATVAKAAPVAQSAQQPAKTGPAPTPASNEDVFDVDSISIGFMPDGVTKTAKAKGGKWTKYGVKVWDEVLALPPLEWDLQELDVAEYGPPKGLKAMVLMMDNKPKKVTGWA